MTDYEFGISFMAFIKFYDWVFLVLTAGVGKRDHLSSLGFVLFLFLFLI